uniref:Carbonic anhydrase 11 n=3 Tax=Cercopithecinae TaxID=9528 RepID=A0A2K5NRQ4_CERAT|nr:unnamed protein product [Macaca fascicularis]
MSPSCLHPDLWSMCLGVPSFIATDSVNCGCCLELATEPAPNIRSTTRASLLRCSSFTSTRNSTGISALPPEAPMAWPFSASLSTWLVALTHSSVASLTATPSPASPTRMTPTFFKT